MSLFGRVRQDPREILLLVLEVRDRRQRERGVGKERMRICRDGRVRFVIID